MSCVERISAGGPAWIDAMQYFPVAGNAGSSLLNLMIGDEMKNMASVQIKNSPHGLSYVHANKKGINNNCLYMGSNRLHATKCKDGVKTRKCVCEGETFAGVVVAVCGGSVVVVVVVVLVVLVLVVLVLVLVLVFLAVVAVCCCAKGCFQCFCSFSFSSMFF